MKKENPLTIATKTINDVFAVLSGRESGYHTNCLELLNDCRIKLDRFAEAKAKRKDMDMKQRDDENSRRLKRELALLEKDYVSLARTNPSSINGTQSHMANLDKIVRDMKRIRGRLGMYSSQDAYLKELLYPRQADA